MWPTPSHLSLPMSPGRVPCQRTDSSLRGSIVSGFRHLPRYLYRQCGGGLKCGCDSVQIRPITPIFIFQISSSLRPRRLEQQAIGSRQACCDDNGRAQVAYGPHPDALATPANASSYGHSAWASALFGLRWRIHCVELVCSQVV